MRRKKVEKLIFNILMLTPLLIALATLIIIAFSNNQTGNEISVDLVLDIWSQSMVFADLEGAFTNMPPLAMPIVNLFTILGFNEMIGFIIGYYINYLIIIELLKILYDFIMFLPRVLRSLMERGIND